MKSNLPLVSVIIPTYNRVDKIRYAIDSVLGQDYPRLEIIVVDDGSVDNTREVLRDFKNIKYIYKENGGVASARNKGLQEAIGEYIAFLDSDDMWGKNKLALQMELALRNPQLGIIYSDIYFSNDQGKRMPKKQTGVKFFRGTVLEELFKQPFIPTSSVVVKKECFESIGFFDEKFTVAEDSDMWLRISKDYTIDYIDKPLVCFCEGSLSSLSKDNYKMIEGSIKYREKMIADNPLLRRKYQLRKTVSRLYSQWGGVQLSRGQYLKALSSFLKGLCYSPGSIACFADFPRLLLAVLRIQKVEKLFKLMVPALSRIKKLIMAGIEGLLCSVLIPTVRHKRNKSKKKNIPVLCFQRIAEFSRLFFNDNTSASPGRFRMMLSYLKKHFSFITPEQMISYMHGNLSVPSNAIMLTFDGGYRENIQTAFPILAALRIPAIVFLTPGKIGNDEISWPDILSYFVRKVKAEKVIVYGYKQYDLSTSVDKKEALFHLYREFIYFPEDKRDEAIACLYQNYGMDITKAKETAKQAGKGYISEGEVRLWQKKGIRFGCQLATDIPLSILEEEQIGSELIKSKQKLESITGRPVLDFAYPYGVGENYPEAMREQLRKTEFKSGMTVISGRNNSNSNIFELKRMIVKKNISFKLTSHGFNSVANLIEEIQRG